MSLVAYDSSDESSEEEASEIIIETTKNQSFEKTTVERINEKLCLPTPKHNVDVPSVDENKRSVNGNISEEFSEKIHFETLPKPRAAETSSVIEEEDDEVLHKTETAETKPETAAKKERGPVKITVPSLSEFKDLDEEENKRNVIMPSKKGTGLFALLPPPKATETKRNNKLIPQVISKKASIISQTQTKASNNTLKKSASMLPPEKASSSKSSLVPSNYDSNSEDEDDTNVKSGNQSPMDFFSLSTTDTLPDVKIPELSLATEVKQSTSSPSSIPSTSSHTIQDSTMERLDFNAEEYKELDERSTLMSNVMSLSKEEILLKNKAEVGPKLPVPEQEYNIDEEGNVAFDDKAIEYLCGRRGIKRKNKEIDSANIIEINGEDIKPDEREWLVKALTEEPIQRPVSMLGGVNSTSKKKHQITYLAHQAKAMEMELKNQWAVNRMTRKQTQSKYGF